MSASVIAMLNVIASIPFVDAGTRERARHLQSSLGGQKHDQFFEDWGDAIFGGPRWRR